MATSTEIFETCCGLCGHEIHEWQFRAIEPNTYNDETRNVHSDCATHREKLSDEYQDVLLWKTMPEVIHPETLHAAVGLNRPGACGRCIPVARQNGTRHRTI